MRNGSLLKVHAFESGDGGTALELQAVAQSGGDLPCYAIVDRTVRYVLVVNVSAVADPRCDLHADTADIDTVRLAYSSACLTSNSGIR